MNESDEKKYELVASKKKELNILITEEDKHGLDISAMSDFFDGYIRELTDNISKEATFYITKDIPASDAGIIGEVLKGAKALIHDNTSFLPDFDHLPEDVKDKLQKGIYSIGESKQVEGNWRPVIMDENNVRIKDITLKKVTGSSVSPDNIIDISGQIQMRQIYSILNQISDLQDYQLDRDRDNNVIKAFLDARNYILHAQEIEDEREIVEDLKKAKGLLDDALNSVYLDIKTTAEHFAKATKKSFFQNNKEIMKYMNYMASDVQMAYKLVGVQARVCSYLDDKQSLKLVLQDYKYVMSGFTTNALDDRGLSASMLLQMYYPYDKENIDLWYHFSEKVQTMSEKNLLGKKEGDIYLISLEDPND